jgi:LuxR family maltose regulon positive regulatory protein
MTLLLNQALTLGIMPDYIDKILSVMGDGSIEVSRQKASNAGLIEPLTAREMEVLKLLSIGCSDKKIAETLVIAPETVHKHLKNIYGKLDVHSRTEAVRRSHELGLL